MSQILQKLRHEDDIDILSTMTDSIICQIISKLTTKEAVGTSVLSSTYKSLWKNITSLSFDYKHFRRDNVILARFVNRVLIFLESKSINKFCLTVKTPCNFYDIPTWVSAAIYRNVKVLRLIIRGGEEVGNGISMPACLYTSKTLEVLEICNSGCGTLSLDVPVFVSLTKLTTLELQNVKYSSDDSARRLITGCPSLEYLVVVRATFDGVATFTINSPKLLSLVFFFEHPKGSIEQDLKFESNAPVLRQLYFDNYEGSNFSVVNLCLLERADIIVSWPQGVDPESHYERVMKNLQGFFNVNHLWISGHTLEALSLAPSPEMDSRHSRLFMDPKSLEYLLEHATECNELYLSEDSSDTTRVVRWSVLPDFPVFLPVCLLSYLETISVFGFRGRESEVSVIAYILKNAKVLKKITISEATSDAEAEFEFREKIMKFNRASSRCEIIFCHL